MTADKESLHCCFLDPVKSRLEAASKAVLSWNVLIAILTPSRSCFKLLVRHQQGSQRIRENQLEKQPKQYLNWEIYNTGCRKARDLLGSDSVRSATICCIPRRTKPTGSSSTPAGDWRHNHSDLAFVLPSRELMQLFWTRNCDFRQLADSSCIYVNRITHEINEMANICTDVIQVRLSSLIQMTWPDVTRTPPCPGQMTTPAPGVATERLSSSSLTPRRQRRTWGSTMCAPTLTAATAGQNEQLSLSRSDSRHKSYSVVKDQYLFKTKIYLYVLFSMLESLYIPSSRYVWIFVSWMLSWLRSHCREDIQWLLTELTE